jgi:anti-sigma B factor antagonist
MAQDQRGRSVTFSLEEQWNGDQTVALQLVGDVDLHTAPQLREHLTRVIDRGATLVVVDLDEVTFIDSTTLGVLLGAGKRLRPRGGQLRIAVSVPSIRKIFEITLLDRIFQLYDSREEALGKPSAGARS